MPFPIGHTAIAAATYECSTRASAFTSVKRLVFIALLANLPDVDIIFGLLLEYNAKAFHRGPTHSLLFALLAGWVAWRIAKGWLNMQGFGFRQCFYLVLSHVVSDALLTGSKVSFFWPLEVNWTTGTAGWFDVIHTVIFESVQDLGIVALCMLVVVSHRWLQKSKSFQRTATAAAELSQSNKALR